VPDTAKPKQKAKETYSRRGFPAMIGALSAKAAKAALDKRGFASGNIINRWPEIVGAELAAFAMPMEIKFPRQRNDQATLVLQVSTGAAATLLQMKTPLLLERINGFLGYAAISRIEALQGPLPRPIKRRSKPQAPLSAEDEDRVNQKIRNIVSLDVRAALQKLGTAIARRRNSG